MFSRRQQSVEIDVSKQVKFSIIPETLDGAFQKYFPTYADGLTVFSASSYVNTPEFAKNFEKLNRFQPKSDDVWIMTFPKCGKFQIQSEPMQFIHSFLLGVVIKSSLACSVT